jgi:predicted ATPase/DNA-binding SARP family transcriptional activator/tetratricopeptide (TPR) repeat protein
VQVSWDSGRMRVGILGPLEVSSGGRPVEVGGARLRVLLLRLAVAVPRVVTVEELADALWPDEKPADQGNAVRTLVSRLRRSLPDPSTLQSAQGGYRLAIPADAVDALEFDQLAKNARRELAQGNAVDAARQLRAALALWRGPALADAARAGFAVGYVAGLDEARLAAVEDCAAAELLCGQHEHLVAELSEVATRHPLRERIQVLLLKALCAQGRHAEALAAYEEVRGRLADELGADPGPDLREVHRAILQGAPEKPRGGNLRVALTSFVGRAAEVERVSRLLADGRLVTLVGPGGAGKTRLATTVAARIADKVPVWLVELAAVTDPADVHLAVLSALGLRESRTVDSRAAPLDTMSRLAEALARAETVIVLDNCEHLVDAVARLADDLLGRCPKLRVLATSREPLGVFGEALCPVPPLEVPEPGATPQQAMATPAVRLLAERAAAVRPGFAVSDENVAPVVEICRRLDGLPLAIELAAARLKSLTAAHLAERLDDRFRLLTGGSRTALPRHQTLRAVVAWSWDLLDDEERAFAERLAVFPASVSLAAAEQVCGQPDTALGLLTALVDKSLLQIADAPGLRYRMLETIREFALERLGDSTEARAAHAAYFLQLAETAEPHFRSREQIKWTAIMSAERDNLVAALYFAAGAKDADTAVRLAAAMAMLWTIEGNRTESIGWMQLALDVPGESPAQARTVVQALHLINKAVAGGFARLDEVVEPFREVVAAAEQAPDHPMLALIEPLLGLFTDDSELGLRAIDARLSHPDRWTRAGLWMLRGAILENEGDMAGMRRDMAHAVAEYRTAGERFGLAQSLRSLADAHLAFGDAGEAAAALEEAIGLLRELNPADTTDHEQVALISARLYQGDVPRARRELEGMIQARDPSTHSLSFAWVGLGDIARREGNLAEAGRAYDIAMAAIDRGPYPAPQFHALVRTAKVFLAIERGEPAEELLAEAAEHALDASDMPVLARVGVAAAALRLRHGDFAAAAKTLGACEQLRGAPDPCHPDIVRLVDRLRTELGGAEFDAAYAQGRNLPRKEAIDQVRRR